MHIRSMHYSCILMERKVNQHFSRWAGAIIKLAHRKSRVWVGGRPQEHHSSPWSLHLTSPPSTYLHCLSLICLLMTRSPFHLLLSLSWKPPIEILYRENLIGLMTMVCIWTALGSSAVSVLEAVKVCLGVENMPWSLIEQGPWGQKV